MIYFPNLLIIGGTGSKAGKTTMACRLIGQVKNYGVFAIKISPHYHEKNDGLNEFLSGEGYCIYSETDSSSGKDTSRMLKAGAARVFLALAWDHPLPDVFSKIMEAIPADTPVICESPSLRKYFEPGIFIMMSSKNPDKRQDMYDLQNLPHMMFKLDDLSGSNEIPILFTKGKWTEK
jgi:hypothetical protein